MALPEPVLTAHNIYSAWDPPSRIRNTSNEDPTKLAVLRAIVSCQVRLDHDASSGWDMVRALTQNWVRSHHSYSLEVEEVHH